MCVLIKFTIPLAHPPPHTAFQSSQPTGLVNKKLWYGRETAKCTCQYRQVYLLTPIDRATLYHARSPIAHCMQVKSPGSKRFVRYLKHIATRNTVTCRSLAPTYTVRPKLHLVDLLSTYYTSKFVTNTQEIKQMELEP